jgi:hypothetical protein
VTHNGRETIVEDVLQVLIAVGGLFILIGFTADSVGRAAVRRKVAEKELSPEQIDQVLKRRVPPDHVLKWALLTTGVGVGFVLIQFLPANMQGEPIVVGLALLFAGGALFLYRAMLKRDVEP